MTANLANQKLFATRLRQMRSTMHSKVPCSLKVLNVLEARVAYVLSWYVDDHHH